MKVLKVLWLFSSGWKGKVKLGRLVQLKWAEQKLCRAVMGWGHLPKPPNGGVLGGVAASWPRFPLVPTPGAPRCEVLYLFLIMKPRHFAVLGVLWSPFLAPASLAPAANLELNPVAMEMG